MKILKVYGEFIMICVKKLSNEDNQAALKKLKSHIQKLTQCNIFKENVDYIAQNLPHNPKQKI